MERNAQQEELKAHLIETDEEYRRLATEHATYAKQLDVLEALAHPSEQEQIDEHRLKKLKLKLKDQMEAIVSRYRTQHVA